MTSKRSQRVILRSSWMLNNKFSFRNKSSIINVKVQRWMFIPETSWNLFAVCLVRIGLCLEFPLLLIPFHFSLIHCNISNFLPLGCWFLWTIWFVSFMVQIHMCGVSSILGSLRRLNHNTVMLPHLSINSCGWLLNWVVNCLLVLTLKELVTCHQFAFFSVTGFVTIFLDLFVSVSIP